MDLLNNFFSALVIILSFCGLSGVLFVTNKSISQIMEHNSETLFGYYSQMKIYLLELKVSLGQENESPLYATLVEREREEKQISVPNDSLKKFENVIDDFILFFKTHDWQIPLDITFEENLSFLLDKLMYLESGNLSQYNSTVESVKQEYHKIVKAIDYLANDISERQKRLADKAQKSQENFIVRIKKLFDKKI